LKQGLNDPYTVEDQVAIIYAVQNLLRNVPVNKVKEFEKDFEFLTTNTEQL
jgi:F-type H+-transporting ATPase subunit alpha